MSKKIEDIESIGETIKNIFHKSGLYTLDDVKKADFYAVKNTIDNLKSKQYNHFYWLSLINRCSTWFWYLKNSRYTVPAPDIIVCPLGHNIFIDPVITPDGNTYDRSNLEIWVKKFNKEPITSNNLKMEDVIPNKQVKSIVEFIRLNMANIDLFIKL